MQRIVINVCHGGFELSALARRTYKEWTGKDLARVPWDVTRDDPQLVLVVEALGTKANTYVSKLKIVSVPDQVNWRVEEQGGWEWVAEEHRTWS